MTTHWDLIFFDPLAYIVALMYFAAFSMIVVHYIKTCQKEYVNKAFLDDKYGIMFAVLIFCFVVFTMTTALAYKKAITTDYQVKEKRIEFKTYSPKTNGL